MTSIKPLEESEGLSLLENQSTSYQDSNENFVRANALLSEGRVRYLFDDAKTLYEVSLQGLEKSGGEPFLGWRSDIDQPYIWITYREVMERAQVFGSGLISNGAKPNPSQLIGIFSRNRVEWKIVEQACNCYSMVLVALHDSLNVETMERVIQHSRLDIIVVDRLTKASHLLNCALESSLQLKLIVVMEEIKMNITKLSDQAGVKVVQFTDLETEGNDNFHIVTPPKPEFLHMICYTCGSSGVPKGVKLTHKNVVANASAIYYAFQLTTLAISSDDIYVSFLPMSHAFERICQVILTYVGARIGFFHGDSASLLDDIRILKPTILPAIPNLLHRIYDMIWFEASEAWFGTFVLRRVLIKKEALLRKKIVTNTTIWDKLFLRKIRNMFGGKLRLCVVGTAPISDYLIKFVRLALGVHVIQGYGLTEATAVVSFSHYLDFTPGSVGPPALCNLVKLIDVPDKDYFAKDQKGEICVKGCNICAGYHNDDKLTASTIDEHGWLHTGDVGMWLPNGGLKIFDRMSNIFKLSNGHYITPEKIERVMCLFPLVHQAFIHGDENYEFVVAMIVPDHELFVAWAASNGVDNKNHRAYVDSNLHSLFLLDLLTFCKEKNLKFFELPKKIQLIDKPFTLEDGLLTVNLKPRRSEIKRRFEEDLNQLLSSSTI